MERFMNFLNAYAPWLGTDNPLGPVAGGMMFGVMFVIVVCIIFIILK